MIPFIIIDTMDRYPLVTCKARFSNLYILINISITLLQTHGWASPTLEFNSTTKHEIFMIRKKKETACLLSHMLKREQVALPI